MTSPSNISNLNNSTKMAEPGISAGDDMSGLLVNQNLATVSNKNDSFIGTGVSQLATRAAFLSLFILFGFMGNCMLVATIAQSKRLRICMLNLHIVSMASANLVDTMLNMPLILGCTITQKWDYGTFMCQFNAFFLQIVNIALLLGLLMMCIDRLVAVIIPEEYEQRLTHRKTVTMIVYTWSHAILFSIPVLTGTIPSKPFPSRYFCSIAESAPLLYIVMSTCFCVLLPVLLAIVFYVIIIRACVQRKVQDQELESQHHYTDSDAEEPKAWTELYGARYVGFLCLFWVLLVGPYVTLNYIEQYRNSAEVQNVPAFIMFVYPWEVDLAFVWMKISYVLILPILTFILRKEVWQKMKDLILCRKSNLIVDASPRGSPRHIHKSRELAAAQTISFKVPVLYATAEGLHVHTYEDETDETFCDTETLPTDLTDTAQSSDTTGKILRGIKCDVHGSQDCLHMDEDTSDYDSQLDPFSVSNPVSVKDLPPADVENDVPMQVFSINTHGIRDNNPVVNYFNDEGVGSQETYISSNRRCSSGRKESWGEAGRTEKGDSGIDSNHNTNEKDRKKSRRRRTKSADVIRVEKNESTPVEKVDCVCAVNDSIQGNVERKPKRRKPPEEAFVQVTDATGLNDAMPCVEPPENEVVSETKVRSLIEATDQTSNTELVKTKRKKKRKKERLNTDETCSDERQSGVVIDEEGCKSCRANQAVDSCQKRLPTRLKPLDLQAEGKPSRSPKSNRKESVDNLMNSTREQSGSLFEKKLIPSIPPSHSRGNSPSHQKVSAGERRVSESAADSVDASRSESEIPGQTKTVLNELDSVSKDRHNKHRNNILHSKYEVSGANINSRAQNPPSAISYRRTNSVDLHPRSFPADDDTSFLASESGAPDQQHLSASPHYLDKVGHKSKKKKKRIQAADSKQDLLGYKKR